MKDTRTVGGTGMGGMARTTRTVRLQHPMGARGAGNAGSPRPERDLRSTTEPKLPWRSTRAGKSWSVGVPEVATFSGGGRRRATLSPASQGYPSGPGQRPTHLRRRSLRPEQLRRQAEQRRARRTWRSSSGSRASSGGTLSRREARSRALSCGCRGRKTRYTPAAETPTPHSSRAGS